MSTILEVNDLSYQNLNHICLSFEEKYFYTIVGSNNCGKTTLFKLLTGIIPTNDCIYCNNIDLNNNNLYEYIKNIGVVERVNKNSFIYSKVIDELLFPLHNLGFNRVDSLKRIKKILNLFDKNDILDSQINDLNYYDKQLLLIILSLLHQPKVLLIDSVLEIFPRNMHDVIIKALKKIIQDGMSVINFTSSLSEAIYSDYIILLDNFQIVGYYSVEDIFMDDKLFYEHNLEIPFLIDLAIKLKMYNVIDKEYFNMKEMVDDIWP